MEVTRDLLSKVGVKAAEINKYFPYLERFSKTFKLDTKERIIAFLSNVLHESLYFKFNEENLNYSEQGLLQIFPRYFSKDTAKLNARNPQKIANKVYANRMGNGNEASEDGWKFRGKGLIQITGYKNTKAFSDFAKVDFIKNPELILLPEFSVLSAFWFWESNKLNLQADKITKAKTEVEKTNLYKSIGSYINRGTFTGTPIGWTDRNNIRKKLEKIIL